MNVGIDQTMQGYIQKIEKTKAAKQLEAKKPRKRKAKPEDTD